MYVKSVPARGGCIEWFEAIRLSDDYGKHYPQIKRCTEEQTYGYEEDSTQHTRQATGHTADRTIGMKQTLYHQAGSSRHHLKHTSSAYTHLPKRAFHANLRVTSRSSPGLASSTPPGEQRNESSSKQQSSKIRDRKYNCINNIKNISRGRS